MQKTIRLALSLAFALAFSPVACNAAPPPSHEGAVPGVWTMDFDAAKVVAAEQNLPILLNFTGSDWCGWCKLMDRNVFSKPEWQDWAKDHILLVWIDFPQNKSLVPEAFVARNRDLSAAFKVTGYPTYVLLQSDGITPIDRLGASQTATPESFIMDIEKALLTLNPDGVSAFLDEADTTAMKTLREGMASVEAKFAEFAEKANREYGELRSKIDQARGEKDIAAANAVLIAWEAAANRQMEQFRGEQKEYSDKLDALYQKALAKMKSLTGSSEKE